MSLRATRVIATLVVGVLIAGIAAFLWPVRAKTLLRRSSGQVRVLFGESKHRSDAGVFELKRPAARPLSEDREGVTRPDILLFLIDTLRPDRLGFGGAPRSTSPFFDSLADGGAVFTNAISQAPWTYPAMASLFTGYFPSDLYPPAERAQHLETSLPEHVPTLASVLSDVGYQTLALSDHPGISPRRFGRGFETFALLPGGPTTESGWGETAEDQVRSAWSDLLSRRDGRPAFAYVHLVYPHLPYEPPPPYDALFGRGAFLIRPWQREGVLRLYDGEIRRTDALVEAMHRDALARRGREHVVTIVTSDHGEGFWEHGLFEHGNSLFGELLRIPLLVHGPGRVSPGRRAFLAQTVDLFPTIAELAGAPAPAGRGLSLLGPRPATSPGSDVDAERIALSEFRHTGDIHARAIQTIAHKLVVGKDGTETAFHLHSDPRELSPLLRAPWATALRDRLATIRPARLTPGQRRRVPLTPDEEGRLRALGYIGGGP